MSETIVPPFAKTTTCRMGGKGYICGWCDYPKALSARRKGSPIKRNSRRGASRHPKVRTAFFRSTLGCLKSSNNAQPRSSRP